MVPVLAPPMLGEGVDATPDGNNQRVPELLRPACSPKPCLAHQQQDHHDDSVGDERRAHDEVGKTLSQMVGVAEAQGSYTAKEHLHPANQRHSLPQDTMESHHERPHTSVHAPLDM
jgi:hypothetical protein